MANANKEEVQTIVVGTWSFSAESVAVATELVNEGMTCEECVEKALNVAEKDEKYGVCQVGRGGPRNLKGELELDAAIMSGRDMKFGAVTALQGISQASSVACRVMEKSPHSMLTSQGAQDFALECGFQLDIPLTQKSPVDEDGVPCEPNKTAGNIHDTLGIIVLDSHRNIAAGVTTSGMRNKARGRIGDSALPGCGLYADNEVGAVCCSGEGDEIMKFCPSFMVMEFMRQGSSPEKACQAAIRRIQQRISPSPLFELAIIAINRKGEVGGASTVKEYTDPLTRLSYPGFPLVVGMSDKEGSFQLETKVVTPVV